ncbi:MAG: LacI family DNA-binding transcriptional regulator [Erysipelotrichaceae bacterium]|nr:LacI family DNA-binding transcriptional regulator [Erysipelotrichaceae bacterium]
MVSMKEIARVCGVSVATVSKALNNKDDIPKATRERIRKKAEEMGYFLNASARALKTKRTYSIGVLFIDSMSAGLAHEYFSAILESFKNTAEEYGYDITFISHTIAGQQSTFLNHCRYRDFDGVAIISADFTDPEIIALAESEIPVVTIDYIYDSCPSVVSDNTRGMRELVAYIAAKGHKKIAFLHGEMTEVTRSRIMGFKEACHQAHIEDTRLISAKYHDIELCAEKTAELMKGDWKPTCIIFPDDYSSLGGRKALEEAGCHVPRDVSVVGYDGIQMASLIGLTTYAQDTRSLGRIACRKLIDKIEDPETMPEHVVVNGKFSEGTSVRDIH